MAGLQAPLSTLRSAPRGALRMTRGQSGLLFLHCSGLSPSPFVGFLGAPLFTLCRSPGAQAYDFFRFVRAPLFGLDRIDGCKIPVKRGVQVVKVQMNSGEILQNSRRQLLRPVSHHWNIVWLRPRLRSTSRVWKSVSSIRLVQAAAKTTTTS